MAILTKNPEMKASDAVGTSFKQAETLFDTSTLFLQTGALQVDYFLEEMEGGKSKTLIPFPSQPQQVTVNRVYAERPIYTFDPEFTYREVAAPRIVEVSLSGQTGMSVRLGINDRGKIAYTEGYNHLQNFEKFIDRYHHHAASHATPIVYSLQSIQNDFDYEARPYLVFRGVKENLHGRCHVTDFRYSRNVGSHRLGSFQWTMTIRIYDTAEAKDPTRFDMGNWAAEWKNAVQSLTGTMVAVQQGFQAGVGQLARDAGGVIDAAGDFAGSLSEFDDAIYGGLGSVVQLSTKISSVFDRLGTLFDGDAWARDWNTALADYTEAGVNNWKRMEFFSDTLKVATKTSTDQWNTTINTQDPTQYNWLFADSLLLETQEQALTTQEMFYQAWLLLGLMGSDQRVSGGVTDVTGFLRREYGFAALAAINKVTEYQPAARLPRQSYSVPYEMRAGQSLLTVANIFLGDPERWIVLAELNNALDAYTKSDGSPYQPGDVIRLPSSGTNAQPMNIELDSEEFIDVIGVDLAMDAYGDIVLSDAARNFRTHNNVEVVWGVDNMKATIVRMLKTATEEVTYDPRYGARFAIIGSKINETNAQLIAARIRERLITDPRILDIQDVQVTVDPDNSDTLLLKLTVICVGLNDIVFTIPIPTQNI